MKEIHLSNGRGIVLVSDEDFEALSADRAAQELHGGFARLNGGSA